jgi:hypothetical protein
MLRERRKRDRDETPPYFGFQSLRALQRAPPKAAAAGELA